MLTYICNKYYKHVQRTVLINKITFVGMKFMMKSVDDEHFAAFTVRVRPSNKIILFVCTFITKRVRANIQSLFFSYVVIQEQYYNYFLTVNFAAPTGC